MGFTHRGKTLRSKWWRYMQIDTLRSSWGTLFRPPSGNKDVPGSERTLFVEWNEEGCGWISSKHLTCQKIKAEHQHLAGELQPIELPEWNWDHITMDFVVGLPRAVEDYDAIWVVVDWLTKSAHFIPIKVKFSIERLAEIYIANIVWLHGVPT